MQYNKCRGRDSNPRLPGSSSISPSFFDKKEKIYRLLIEGIYPSKIAKILKVSRQYVNQVVKELEKAGVIKCLNPKGKPKFYTATDIPFSYVKRNKAGIQQGKCRVHACAFKAVIIDPPKKQIPWVKKWTLPNGTRYFSRKEVLDIGLTTFIRVVSKSKDELIIFLEEKYMTAEELRNFEKNAGNIAQRAANWFMKKYYCQLGILEINQKPHFGFKSTNEIAVIAEKMNIDFDKFHIDNSKGNHEWETREIELAIAKAEAPKRILELEKKVSSLENQFSALIDSIERLEASIQQLLELSKMPETKPDNREVV